MDITTAQGGGFSRYNKKHAYSDLIPTLLQRRRNSKIIANIDFFWINFFLHPIADSHYTSSIGENFRLAFHQIS
jgi:hypothetical protein